MHHLADGGGKGKPVRGNQTTLPLLPSSPNGRGRASGGLPVRPGQMRCPQPHRVTRCREHSHLSLLRGVINPRSSGFLVY